MMIRYSGLLFWATVYRNAGCLIKQLVWRLRSSTEGHIYATSRSIPMNGCRVGLPVRRGLKGYTRRPKYDKPVHIGVVELEQWRTVERIVSSRNRCILITTSCKPSLFRIYELYELYYSEKKFETLRNFITNMELYAAL